LSEPTSADLQPTARLSRAQWAILALGIILLVVAFFWTGQWMVIRWEHTSGYYSHGWLIGPVALGLLWLNRKELAACQRKPNRWGLLIVIPSLLLHLAGVALVTGVVSGLAMIALLAGLVLTLFGRRTLRLLLFPIIFLLFMIPLPEVVVEKISFTMKLMAAALATKAVEAVGLVVVRDGSIIHLPPSQYIDTYQRLIVDDVCSGLKYLISLTAFGALYAYIARVKYTAKAILFLCSIPISFVANVMRVIVMIFVAYRWGVEKIEGGIHDFFGIMLFVTAFVFLFILESFLRRFCRMAGEQQTPAVTSKTPDNLIESPSNKKRMPSVRPSMALQISLLISVALTAGLSAFLYRPRPAINVSGILATIPKTIGAWKGIESPVTQYEKEILGTQDVLSIRYFDNRGNRARLLIVLARQTRKRTHPPEQCYRGEGYRLSSARRFMLTLPGLGSRPVPTQEVIFAKESEKRLVWYFFKCGPDLSASWWTHQGRVAARKLFSRDVADILIRVDTGVGLDEGRIEEGRGILKNFLDSALPIILPQLP